MSDSLVNAPDMTAGRADVDELLHVECAVVIVTYNSGNHISDLLDTLLAASDGVTLRVIVVDNGSADDTVQLVRSRGWVTCVETGRNLGYAGAINVGRRLARPCSSILVLNPDLHLEPGSVGHLFEALRDPDVGIAVPMILDRDNRRYPSLRREPSILRALGDALLGARMRQRPTWSSETVHDDHAYAHRHAIDWATGAVLLVADRCDELVGDWDDGRFFLYSEETDFARRARTAGFRIDYVPQARARHLGAGSGESHGLVALMAVNRIRYFEKHHRRPASAAYRAAVIVGELLRASDPGHRSALRRVVKRANWAMLPQAERAG